MNRFGLLSAGPQPVLTLFRVAGLLAVGSCLLGTVSLLLTVDLPQVSQRLWDVGGVTTGLAVLATVLGIWLKQENAKEPTR
jgi:hypothetical protein